MTKQISRRTALTTGLAATAASCSTTPKMTAYTAVGGAPADGLFAHGVASGDPAADSVVIWTRVSLENSSGPVTVVWETAADADFTDVRGKGESQTGAARDFTVKVLLQDLAPGETYYYRFRVGDNYSPVGRTKTLPAGAIEEARFAIVSCSNYPFGYFNVYDLIARRDDLDAVIHLGDYIYEYSTEGYGGEAGAALGRIHQPAHEIVSLEDYRTRHAQYKADPSSQAMHGRHPLISIWDDHETSNDSWKDGAQNHQPETEGDWNARRRAALQAYYEWMPVRDPEPGKPMEALFRNYAYGDLLSLTAIETRLMARARQFEYSEVLPTLETPEDVERFRNEILRDPTRELLGSAQIDFIDRAFREAAAANRPWRLIANQIIMAEVISPDLTPHVAEEDLVELEKQWDQARAFVKISSLGLPTNFDAWDGYPAARDRFYKLAKETGADNMIVVTGDTHTWWANDLADSSGQHMGVELGTNSVTSPSPYSPNFLGGRGAEYALLTNRDNKSVRYLSGENHGYISLHITPEKARAEYKAVDTIESQNYQAFTKVAFDIKKSNDGAEFDDADGLGFREGFLF